MRRKRGATRRPSCGLLLMPVDDDRPGAAATRHQPGRHRAELAGDAHLPVRQAEGAARIAGVDIGFDRDVAFGHEVPPDVGQAAGDGVVIAGEDRPDDGVALLPVKPKTPGGSVASLRSRTILCGSTASTLAFSGQPEWSGTSTASEFSQAGERRRREEEDGDHADREQTQAARRLRRAGVVAAAAPRGSACPTQAPRTATSRPRASARCRVPCRGWRGGATRIAHRVARPAPCRTRRAWRSRSAGRRRRSAVRSVMSSNRTWVRQFRDGVGRASFSARVVAPRAWRERVWAAPAGRRRGPARRPRRLLDVRGCPAPAPVRSSRPAPSRMRRAPLASRRSGPRPRRSPATGHGSPRRAGPAAPRCSSRPRLRRRVIGV